MTTNFQGHYIEALQERNGDVHILLRFERYNKSVVVPAKDIKKLATFLGQLDVRDEQKEKPGKEIDLKTIGTAPYIEKRKQGLRPTTDTEKRNLKKSWVKA